MTQNISSHKTEIFSHLAPNKQVSDVVQQCLANHGIDPRNLYCQVTGKPVGTINLSELDSVILSMTGDSEEIADDLVMRVCASMRPSIRWNFLRVDTVAKIAKSNPDEVLAYLVNRIFHPNFTAALDAQLDSMIRRVKTFNFISRVGMTPKMLEAMHWCLRVDAVMPANAKFGLTGISFESEDEFCATITRVCDDALVKHERESRGTWSTGSQLVTSAYYNSFNRRRAESPTAQAKQAKQKSVSFLDNALDSLLGNKPLHTIKQEPIAPVKRAVMPKRFGVKS